MGHGAGSKRSDGGKGSSRRNEDVSKINENWDRIFKKETKMEDYADAIDDFDEDDEQHECSWCLGCGEGDYDGAACRKCHGTGIEPRDSNERYDEI